MRIIFDLDGTLIDTMGPMAVLESDLLSEVGLNISAKQIQACPEVVALGVPIKFVKYAESYGHIIDDKHLDFLRVEHEKRLYSKHRAGDFDLFSGTKSMLQELVDRGHKLCIGTNNPSDVAADALRHTEFYDYFEERIFGQDHNNGILKPDPGIFRKALEEDAKAVVIEDSLSGAEAAFNLSLPCFIFTPNPISDEDTLKFKKFNVAGFFKFHVDLPNLIDSIKD